jgi:glycosyltransferase involved in cell wall biosynthesis
MANINLESMAAGCCTIATDGYGNDEVITDGENGFLYEPKNVNQLSLLLKECIQNFPYHIGLNAKRRIKRDFSIDRIANEYIRIYEKLIENK